MLLSLCMPTNGIGEWAIPAIESIYSEGVEESKFEVIVADNGRNHDFQKCMEKMTVCHKNLIYRKTNAYMFANQLEVLKFAKGDYLKFVNHRSIFLPGRLEYLLQFLEENERDHPIIYFSNGAMGWGPNYREYASFDQFVKNLGIYGTWTSGVGIWREDYEKIPKNIHYESISPHACILYSERNKNKYIINDKYWMKEITLDHSKKGKYNLYKAFSLDEFIITINLYRDGDISVETLKSVKESFRDFLVKLYYDFNISGMPCSYDISGFEDYVGIFFDKEDIKTRALNKLEPYTY